MLSLSKHKVVANSAEGILELLAFANKKANSTAAELFIIMEATGVYHEIAAEALFNAGCKLAVVNPAYTNASTGSAQETLPKRWASKPKTTKRCTEPVEV